MAFDIESFLWFARRPEEFAKFTEAHPELVTPWSGDGIVPRGRGQAAAMAWAPEVDARVQAWRRSFNRRMSARYSPLEFLEQSERDWADTCVALTRTFHEDGTTEGGDPHAVPFPWTRLLERLRTPEERVLVPLEGCPQQLSLGSKLPAACTASLRTSGRTGGRPGR